jgi:hypothetical protein
MIKGFIDILLRRFRFLNLFLLMFMGPIHSFGGGDTNEYNVKAMFVLNFIKYVEWPSADKDNIFRIGIAGESELYDALEAMMINRSEFVKIKIEKLKPEQIENIQILIISKKEKSKTEEWSKKYHGKGVLIISDEGKDAGSSAINLKNIDHKIRFEINNTQAKLGGVKISSRLTKLATTVQP